MLSVWTEERIRIAREEMKRWQGTPHANRIAIRGKGVDCIKFVMAVCCAAGIVPHTEFYGYDVTAGMWKESSALQETMLRCLHAEWVTDSFKFGDIFVLKTGRRSGHCGIYTADGFVWHALGKRCVTRSDYSLWRREIVGMVRIIKEGFRVDPRSITFNV